MNNPYALPADTADETWRDEAACFKLGDHWFSDDDDKHSEARFAVRTCQSCPVQAECLQYALDAREPFGIWGGKTHTQRARMLRRDTTLPGVVHAVGSEVEYKRHLAQATTPCVACRRAHAIFNAEKRQQLKVST